MAESPWTQTLILLWILAPAQHLLRTRWHSQKAGPSAATSLRSHPGSLPAPPPRYLSPPLSTVHSPDLVQGIIFFSQVLHRHPAVLDRASPSYSRAQSTAEMNMPCSLSKTIHGSRCSED